MRPLGVLIFAAVWLGATGGTLRAAAPVGLSGNAGTQPGGVVMTDDEMCSLNFIFRAPDGTRYIGTAGHCILRDSPIEGESPLPGGKEGTPRVTEKTWAPGSGPVARDSSDHRLGEFAYAVLEDPKDFALIRLDPGVNASPQVAFFGGPTGINTDRSNRPVTLEYYGNGVAVGWAVPARSALAPAMADPDRVYALGLAAPGTRAAPSSVPTAGLWGCSSRWARGSTRARTTPAREHSSASASPTSALSWPGPSRSSASISTSSRPL